MRNDTLALELNQSVIRKKRINSAIRYILLSLVAFVMLYPVLWLAGASFKSNTEIFSSISFIPKSFDFSSFVKGWNTGTEYTFTTFFKNSFIIVIPSVLLTVISCTLVAYGYTRFNVPFKKPLFSILISTLFLPAVVTRIPLFMFWRDLGLLNTYIPLIAPCAFAHDAFFVFMLIQFMRGLPKEYDEAATIDGCGSFKTLIYILVPMLKPAMVTVVLFKFIWTFNNFMEPMIYVSSVEKFPVSVALRMVMDQAYGASAVVTPWNQMIAMSLIGLLPSIIVFFSAQNYFIDGISAGGLKG